MSASLETPLVQLVSLSIIISLIQHGAFAHRIDEIGPSGHPQGYVVHPTLNVAYKLHLERRRWNDAKEICEREGGRLATIDTATKLIVVKEKKPRFSEAWVGFTKEDGTWVDASHNSRETGLPWEEDAPDTFGACAAVNVAGDGLCNKLCIWRKPFVCERALP